MIGIIDYGMGNLHSVSSALERLDQPYFLSDQIEELAKADKLLLPGVGSFKDAMAILNGTGLADFIKEEATAGKPLLGICLGMQILFEESEENGITKGLGLLPGTVERFSGKTSSGETYKVPHMGWNKLEYNRTSPLIENLDEGYVYFVHSYAVQTGDSDCLIAQAQYGGQSVPAVVGQNNIFGTQFHPEKSSEVGMTILSNFCNLAEEAKA
ncbi:imidazole glycerol phosphate synthase subunit HisH [Fictibacillus sp. KIGAM418]|uniref:Imidazole glycerol phosphate synthase subunit HisH n=1 Tax=Fictibacillus marinisediminis TaxID=2878389 RepID=A0A9X1XGD3_9BACL|nr:imidazole glycerol phosphate synthase subunit HisH [Fictibacillus marinisediminis]MCK6258570.1 imidazole glycerol phosphate synthase subunit HisH [Fictibacillus marinisediminis]